MMPHHSHMTVTSNLLFPSLLATPVVTAITQSPYIVVSGGTAVLSFQVESDIHAVTLSASNWRLTNDEEIIAEDQRFTFSEDFTSLAISPVHVADEGTYTLTATNNAGLTGSGYILLVVQCRLHNIFNFVALLHIFIIIMMNFMQHLRLLRAPRPIQQ